MMLMLVMKLPILMCTEKLENSLVNHTKPRTKTSEQSRNGK